MNLFLAMLCVSYDAAHRAAHRSFMRSRARIVLDQHAVRVGIARFLCCFWKEFDERIVYSRKGSDYDGSISASLTPRSANNVLDNDNSCFLWFAKQTEFESYA